MVESKEVSMYHIEKGLKRSVTENSFTNQLRIYEIEDDDPEGYDTVTPFVYLGAP